MIQRSVTVFLSALLVLMMLVGISWAQTKGQDQAVEITLDFQNVELVDMISTISELTGKNFVYDEGVRGKVSILSPRPVTIDEAYKLFITVLNVKGFTIIPSGQVNKIVPIRSAKEANLPISDGRGLGEQFITRILELKNLDAAVVVDTILRPLMPKTSHVVAHVATNTVVITDSATNIERLVRILDSLDRSWDGDAMEIVQLYFSDAEETATVVMQILEGGGPVSTSGRGKAAATVGKKAPGQIIPYARTNKLMLLGDQKFIARAKRIVTQLDERADLTRAGVHVYYLEHAESEGLSETLNKILSGASKTAPGQKAAAGKLFGGVTITADKPTNALIVNATAEDYDGVKELIAQLDIKRKQVFVEVLILELSMDALLEVGASLQMGADANNDSVVFGTSNLNKGSVGLTDLNRISDGSSSPTLLSRAVSGILLGGLFNPISTIGADGSLITVPALSALIQLSETDTDINVLSAPRLLTSDNEEAEIVVGSNVPIISSTTKDNDGKRINTVERQDVALTLRFTPQVTEGNLVRLKVFQEISDLVPSNQSVGTVDDVGPTFKKRMLRNSIVARDGKTVVLGGMFQTDRTEVNSKVPLLGDIPFLGRLFRSSSTNETKTSLLIFITPRVIRNSDDLERITNENRANYQLFNQEEGGELFDLTTQEIDPVGSADVRGGGE